MKTFHLLLLCFVFGLFLPTQAFACETNSPKTEKTCCKKQSSAKKKDCCKKQHPSKNTKDNCNGKCKHVCHAPSVQFNFVAPFVVSLNGSNFSTKKQKIYTPQSNLSSGFLSLWLLPKIG